MPKRAVAALKARLARDAKAKKRAEQNEKRAMNLRHRGSDNGSRASEESV